MGINKDASYQIKSRSSFMVAAAVVLVAIIAVMGVTYYINGGNGKLNENDDALFNNGVTAVYDEEGWGYITRSGRYVIEPSYSLALGFSPISKLALVYTNSNTEFSYIKKSGHVAAGPFKSAGRCVSSSFFGGYAIAENIENEKCGYINKKGEWISKPEYESARNFKNGFAAVQKDGAWGYIGRRGVQKIPFIYDNAGSFTDDGLAAVQKDGLWGYINKKNKMVIKPQFAEAQDFSNNRAAVRDEEGWHYINKKGEIIIDGDFDDVSIFAANGLAAVCKAGEWGYINKKGEFVIEPAYRSAERFRKCGHAAVLTEDGYAIINKRGHIITRDKYAAMSVYDDGYAVFSEDSKAYGIMTCRGRIIREPQYNYVSFDRLYNRSVFDRVYE